MDLQYILENRPAPGGAGRSGSSSKGKSSSKSKSKGPVFGSGGSSSNDGWGRLPVWARILIIVGAVVLIIWVASFIYFLFKELQRKRSGKSFRLGHALWGATKVATGLWFFIWIFKSCAGKKKPTSYTKIDEAGNGRINNPSVYGATAGTAYASGGTGYNGAGTEGKYEPMGYTPQYSAHNYAGSVMTENQPHTSSMAPSPVPTAPPAYAPPAQAPAGGAAASYFEPPPPTQSGYSPSPPVQSPTYNAQPSATYMPSQSHHMPQF